MYKALVIDATPTRDGVDIDISAGLDSPIFQILIIAAGGRAEISAFCTAILNSTSDPDGIGTPPIIGPYGSRGALYSHPWEPTGWPLRRSPH